MIIFAFIIFYRFWILNFFILILKRIFLIFIINFVWKNVIFLIIFLRLQNKIFLIIINFLLGFRNIIKICLVIFFLVRIQISYISICNLNICLIILIFCLVKVQIFQIILNNIFNNICFRLLICFIVDILQNILCYRFIF